MWHGLRQPTGRRALTRGALLVVCLVALQQCSKPPGGTNTPGGPTTPTPGPPSVPTPTPTPSTSPQTFVGAGDIAICGTGNQEATAKLLDTIGGTVFTLGDNAYPNGSAENFRDCYENTWGRHKDRTRPAPGNHDYNTPGASVYYQYFGANAGTPGQGYYSYDLGAWHILSLNSNEPMASGAAQEAWIRADLNASTAKCSLAYWHHPLISSSQNGDSPFMRGIFRTLYEHNVDVVLAGHDHSYERFAPMDPDGRPDAARGIRQFVVGTGGVPFYNFVSLKPNSDRRLTGAGYHGVLKMTLQAEAYQWEFITVGQGTPDSGNGTCH